MAAGRWPLTVPATAPVAAGAAKLWTTGVVVGEPPPKTTSRAASSAPAASWTGEARLPSGLIAPLVVSSEKTLASDPPAGVESTRDDHRSAGAGEEDFARERLVERPRKDTRLHRRDGRGLLLGGMRRRDGLRSRCRRPAGEGDDQTDDQRRDPDRRHYRPPPAHPRRGPPTLRVRMPGARRPTHRISHGRSRPLVQATPDRRSHLFGGLAASTRAPKAVMVMIVVPIPLPGGEASSRTTRPSGSIHALTDSRGGVAPLPPTACSSSRECRRKGTTARSGCGRRSGREVDRDEVTARRPTADVGRPERGRGDRAPRNLGEEEVGILSFDLECELVEGGRVRDAFCRFRCDPGDAVRKADQVLGGRMVEHDRGLEDDRLDTGGLADLRPTRCRGEAERSATRDRLRRQAAGEVERDGGGQSECAGQRRCARRGEREPTERRWWRRATRRSPVRPFRLHRPRIRKPRARQRKRPASTGGCDQRLPARSCADEEVSRWNGRTNRR